MRRAEVRFSTLLYWRNDWRLASRVTSLDAALPDRCVVTVLRLDATPLMQKVVDAQVARLTQQIDSALPTLLDLRPAAESLWQAMQEPVALDSTNQAWLLMSPEGVSLAPLAGRGDVVETAVLVTARPRVVLGPRPRVVARALPTLSLTRQVSGLHVPVQIELPFAELSDRVSALLAGATAGQGLRVGGVKLWGVADTAVVRLELSGKVSGALYLLGRFAYDSATRTIVIHDLRYTLASRDAMTRVKATVGAPLIKRAIDEATGRGRLNIGAQLDSVRAQLTRELNRPLAPGASLSGAIESVRILGVHTTPTAFVVRVVLDGEARLRVE
jgi:hypothetical protein